MEAILELIALRSNELIAHAKNRAIEIAFAVVDDWPKL
jgi:hypothetical protein